jgi:iron-sulfur cluster assembly protein
MQRTFATIKTKIKNMEQLTAQAGNEAAPIQLTERAVTELRELMVSQGKADSALRVWVAGGGCSGLSYGMALDDAQPEEGDNVLTQDGVKVFIDGLSLSYMTGAVVDYVDDMMGGGFKIENPNAVSGCGCGSSFSTEEGQGGGSGCGSCGCK